MSTLSNDTADQVLEILRMLDQPKVFPLALRSLPHDSPPLQPPPLSFPIAPPSAHHRASALFPLMRNALLVNLHLADSFTSGRSLLKGHLLREVSQTIHSKTAPTLLALYLLYCPL